MKTEYKHIHFDDISYLYPERKTQVWECLNEHADILGIIRWYSPWRQFCFFPENDTFFSVSCQNDITDFTGQVNKERKNARILHAK